MPVRRAAEREAEEDRHQRGLPAGDRVDVLGRRLDAELLEPGGAGLAIGELALGRLVMREIVEIALRRQRGDGVAETLVDSGGQRLVQAEIDRILALHQRQIKAIERSQGVARLSTVAAGRGIVDDEGAAPDRCVDQPAPRRLGIGLRHRAHRDAEPLGEIAMGGQLRAGAQPPAADRLLQRIRQRGRDLAAPLQPVAIPFVHRRSAIVSYLGTKPNGSGIRSARSPISMLTPASPLTSAVFERNLTNCTD
jgi:hypothetical protein